MGELSRMLTEVAELKRRVAGGQHQGAVAEVKGDKMRVEWGKDADGKPVLSPWLDSSDHRGGARERRYYKKGQNVTIATVGGEMNESATVSADAPSDNFKPPDHADSQGDEAETYQLGELRTTKKKDGYEVFLGKEGKTKLRINEKGGISGKVGDARFAAHEKGAKIKFGDKPNSPFILVNEDGVFTSTPIQILPNDPIPDDKE